MENFDLDFNPFADAHIIIRKVTACAYENCEESVVIGYVAFESDVCTMSEKEFRESVFAASDAIMNATQAGDCPIHVEVRFTRNYVNA